MGDEPVGNEDVDLDETEAKNLTLTRRTWLALEEQYPHALDDPERVRQAIHDALDTDENED